MMPSIVWNSVLPEDGDATDQRILIPDFMQNHMHLAGRGEFRNRTCGAEASPLRRNSR